MANMHHVLLVDIPIAIRINNGANILVFSKVSGDMHHVLLVEIPILIAKGTTGTNKGGVVGDRLIEH